MKGKGRKRQEKEESLDKLIAKEKLINIRERETAGIIASKVTLCKTCKHTRRKQ